MTTTVRPATNADAGDADIMALILGTSDEAPEQETVSDDQQDKTTDTAEEDDSSSTSTDQEVNEDEENEEEKYKPSDDVDDDSGEEEVDDHEDEPATVEYRDDDVISVKVDGEMRDVTLGDLVKNYSLGEATNDRMRQATQFRNEWQQTRTKAIEDVETVRASFIELMGTLQKDFIVPVIPKPDPSVAGTNPRAFQRAMEMYEEDQTRVKKQREQIGELLVEQLNGRQEGFVKYQNEQRALLADVIPQLADKEEGPKTAKLITDHALSVGFSPEEISMAADHRIYVLAYKAALYDQLSKKGSVNPSGGDKDTAEVVKKAKNKVRRLSPGGTAKVAAKSSNQEKQRKRQLEKAKKTGAPEDIMPLLFEAPTKSPRGHRRR